MIIIAGSLFLEPRERDRYLAAVSGVAVAARDAPGCLDFVQSADVIDPERINVYERWISVEHVQRFRRSGAPQPQLPAVRSASVEQYRVAAVEAP
jgi:quinol monooxygenase YgiN